jgi:hypothetical protein
LRGCWENHSLNLKKTHFGLKNPVAIQKAIQGVEKSGTKSGTVKRKSGTISGTASSSTLSQNLAKTQAKEGSDGVSPGKREEKQADGEGFEPPVPFGTPVFKTGAIVHSATHPIEKKLARRLVVGHDFSLPDPGELGRVCVNCTESQ